jgi:hypothetical protein
MKILLDIAKESADWFPPLKSALGGVSAIVKHYEVPSHPMALVHNLFLLQQFDSVKDNIQELIPQLERFKRDINTTKIDGDPEETNRRLQLIGYVLIIIPSVAAVAPNHRSAHSNKSKRNRTDCCRRALSPNL